MNVIVKTHSDQQISREYMQLYVLNIANFFLTNLNVNHLLAPFTHIHLDANKQNMTQWKIIIKQNRLFC